MRNFLEDVRGYQILVVEALSTKALVPKCRMEVFMVNEDISLTDVRVNVEAYCDNARLVDSLKSGNIIGAMSV